MDMRHAETFGDLSSQVSQGDDYHSLFKIQTQELIGTTNELDFEKEQYDFNQLLTDETAALKSLIKPLTTPYTASYADHTTKTPELGELSFGAYNFSVGIKGQECKSPYWCYSTKLQKLYVKKKISLTVDVAYHNPAPGSALYLRIMMVCSSPQDVHKTIYRCPYDIAKDNVQGDNWKRDHIVQCLNPEAEYIGKPDGVAFKDRLAMKIALQGGVGEHQVTPVSLEFLCQNSCPTIERRATSLVFTLENEYGAILGRTAINVKICSCPKRDMDKEENKGTGGAASATKRKHDDNTSSAATAAAAVVEQEPPRKLTRQSSIPGAPRPARSVSAAVRRDSPVPSTSAVVPLECIKKETPAYVPLSRSSSSISNTTNTVENDSTAVVLTLRLPDIATAVAVAGYAFNHISGDMMYCRDEEKRNRLAKFLTHCRRTKRDTVKRMEEANESELEYDSD